MVNPQAHTAIVIRGRATETGEEPTTKLALPFPCSGEAATEQRGETQRWCPGPGEASGEPRDRWRPQTLSLLVEWGHDGTPSGRGGVGPPGCLLGAHWALPSSSPLPIPQSWFPQRAAGTDSGPGMLTCVLGGEQAIEACGWSSVTLPGPPGGRLQYCPSAVPLCLTHLLTLLKTAGPLLWGSPNAGNRAVDAEQEPGLLCARWPWGDLRFPPPGASSGQNESPGALLRPRAKPRTQAALPPAFAGAWC